MDVDEVHVRAEVQLEASELPERQHDEAGWRRAARRRSRSKTELVARLGHRHLEGDGDESVGDRRERAERLRHRRETQQVPHRDAHDLAPPRTAQRIPGSAGAGRGDRRAHLARDLTRPPRPGQHPTLRHPLRPLGMADQLLGQEGAPPQGPEKGPRRVRAAVTKRHERSRTARAHEPLEAAEGRVGVGHLGERTQQEREVLAEEAAKQRIARRSAAARGPPARARRGRGVAGGPGRRSRGDRRAGARSRRA